MDTTPAPAPRATTPLPRRRLRAFVIHAALATAAAGLAFLAAWLHQRYLCPVGMTVHWEKVPQISLGEAIGILMGFLVGVRSRRLAGWVLGPPAGFLVGFLDVRTQYLLGCQEGLTPRGAALVPVWGALAGFVLAAANRRTRAAMIVLGAVPLADAVGRVACGRVPGDPAWLAQALCFAPACAVIACAVPKAWRGDRPSGTDAPSRFGYWLAPAAAAAILAAVVEVRVGMTRAGAPEGAGDGKPWEDKWGRNYSGPYEGLGLPQAALAGMSPKELNAWTRERFHAQGYAVERHSHHARTPMPWDCLWLFRDDEATVGFEFCTDSQAVQELESGQGTTRDLDPALVYVEAIPLRKSGAWILALNEGVAQRVSLEEFGGADWEKLLAGIPDYARRLAARAALTYRSDLVRLRWIDRQVTAFLERARERRKR